MFSCVATLTWRGTSIRSARNTDHSQRDWSATFWQTIAAFGASGQGSNPITASNECYKLHVSYLARNKFPIKLQKIVDSQQVRRILHKSSKYDIYSKNSVFSSKNEAEKIIFKWECGNAERYRLYQYTHDAMFAFHILRHILEH